MDNHRRLQKDYSPSNQLYSHNPNVRIPPPPLPPRFPPANVPMVTPAPFPPPNHPLHPPARAVSVYPLPSWDSGLGHPSNLTVNQHFHQTKQFLQSTGNAQDPPRQLRPPFLARGGSVLSSQSLDSCMAMAHTISHTLNQPPPMSKRFTLDLSCNNQQLHSTPSWDTEMARPSNYLPVNQPPPLVKTTQDWVDQWTRNKHKLEVTKCDIKIYEIREKQDKAFNLIRELENSSRTLGVMVKTVSSEEWEKKCNEVEENKKKLVRLLDEFNLTDAEFKCLREKISKRTKKRARLRRQSDRLKKQKEEEKIKEQNRRVQIDNWQRELQDRVERVKREEDLKKEADAVLWGVTQKKTEAKRQVAMLAALLNLRSVRVARLTAAGLPVSQSQIDTFNTVIERLKTMWSRHLEECQLEEQALRGMLGPHSSITSDATDAVTTYKRLVLHEWEAVIFGAPGDTPMGSEGLVNVRRSWDRFAMLDPMLLASAVPPGYVLPVPPSSDQWRSFLKY